MKIVLKGDSVCRRSQLIQNMSKVEKVYESMLKFEKRFQKGLKTAKKIFFFLIQSLRNKIL